MQMARYDPECKSAKSWRDVIKIHPAAELFPMMSEDELKALGEDIKKNGLDSHIKLWSPKDGDEIFLLDGRNRLDAMEAVGIELISEGWFRGLDGLIWKASGETVDPYAYVISANIHRRHLTAEQKRELIANLLKAAPEKSNNSIAKQVKADDKTVASVRRELESTSEIPKLEKTVGKDGKARKQPAKKKRRTPEDFQKDIAAKKAAASEEKGAPEIPGGSALMLAWDRAGPNERQQFVMARKLEIMRAQHQVDSGAQVGDGFDIPGFLDRTAAP